MRMLALAALAVVALSACGGPLEDETAPVTAASSSSQLNGTEPPPMVPPPFGDDIQGQTQVLQFDLSNGRITARLSAPSPEERFFYQAKPGCLR